MYAGSTPKYYIELKDENGVQLDPDVIGEVIEVILFAYKLDEDQTEVTKFYLNVLPTGTDWTEFGVVDLGGGDKRIIWWFTDAQTKANVGNDLMVQVKLTIPDTEMPNNQRVITATGKMEAIQSAKNE